MIPEAAVEAACRAEFSDWDTNGDEWWRGMTRKRMRKALEAAAPHMLAGAKADALDEAADDVSLRIDQIEAHHVPESEYGTLLAQREEAVSIYRDIRARAATYRPTK